MNILLITNSYRSLINFRKSLINELSIKNTVTVICPYENHVNIAHLKINANLINIKFRRKGTNIFFEFLFFIKLFLLIYKVKPNVILNFTIKPNIYGSIISRILNIKCINTITGLGNTFINKNFLTRVVNLLYKLSIKKSFHNFFHNKDDIKIFKESKLITNNYSLINGSGVDLFDTKEFEYPYVKNLNFLFIGRIMKEKGIVEFCKAANDILLEYENCYFFAAGDFENKEIISKIQYYKDNNIVNFLGYINNISKFIKESSAVILPSYREGLPHSLLIASAHARPIIATAVPGCNVVVKNNFNGFLCESKNYKSLRSSIIKFIKLDYEMKKKICKKIAGKYHFNSI